MSSNIKNLIECNTALFHFACLKNVNFGGIASLTNPYAINNIKAINT